MLKESSLTKDRRATTAVLALLAIVMGCSADRSSPTNVLRSPTSPTPTLTAVQPVVTGITPSVGSERGGNWGTVTGANFAAGAKLTLGSSTTATIFQNSTTIAFTGIPAHAAGTVDVMVTNPGGLSGTLFRGYTFAPPAAFDFNGDWIAHAGPEYEIDMGFSIRQNRLVKLTCGGMAVAISAPADVSGAEFSVSLNADVAMTGTVVSPVNAVGTIDVPMCATSRWWADKAHD